MRAEGEDDYDSLVGEFIKQYYSQWSSIPPELLLIKPLKEASLIEDYLKSLKEGRRVRIYVPKRGPKKALLDMARKDTAEMEKTLDDRLKTPRKKRNALVERLSAILSTDKTYYRVESYDISNTNGWTR